MPPTAPEGPTTPTPSALSIAEQGYIRERTDPDPDDFDYLHLSDLRDGLRLVLPAEAGEILDYGCGGSPYRTLVACRRYHRADFPGPHGLNFVLGADATVPAPDHTYDLILSTQVLEHVASPQRYLTECRRLLRPRGKLVLSTHGTFNDHGCPHDYWRWTADGLQLLLKEQGFKVHRLFKLTTGPRALLYLNRRFQSSLVFRTKSPLALGLRLSRLIFTRTAHRRVHELSDCEHGENRVVPANQTPHSLYIALLVEAEPT